MQSTELNAKLVRMKLFASRSRSPACIREVDLSTKEILDTMTSVSTENRLLLDLFHAFRFS